MAKCKLKEALAVDPDSSSSFTDQSPNTNAPVAAKCSICGRDLSNPTSIKMRMGPGCRRRWLQKGRGQVTLGRYMHKDSHVVQARMFWGWGR